jgi:hypothetical protein
MGTDAGNRIINKIIQIKLRLITLKIATTKKTAKTKDTIQWVPFGKKPKNWL